MKEHDMLIMCTNCNVYLPSEILIHHYNHNCDSFRAYSAYDKLLSNPSQVIQDKIVAVSNLSIKGCPI